MNARKTWKIVKLNWLSFRFCGFLLETVKKIQICITNFRVVCQCTVPMFIVEFRVKLDIIVNTRVICDFLSYCFEDEILSESVLFLFLSTIYFLFSDFHWLLWKILLICVSEFHMTKRKEHWYWFWFDWLIGGN